MRDVRSLKAAKCRKFALPYRSIESSSSFLFFFSLAHTHTLCNNRRRSLSSPEVSYRDPGSVSRRRWKQWPLLHGAHKFLTRSTNLTRATITPDKCTDEVDFWIEGGRLSWDRVFYPLYPTKLCGVFKSEIDCRVGWIRLSRKTQCFEILGVGSKKFLNSKNFPWD